MSEDYGRAPEIAVSDLATLENLVPQARLTGRTGRNRAPGRRQIEADDDRAAVLAWLARYTDSPATLASYRKEAERLLLWCVFERGRAFSDLAHEDLLLYQRFLADPQPADRWVMPPGKKLARLDAGWRPFAGPLSAASQRQALSILNGLFNWLVEAGYLAGNPLALRRRTRAPRPVQRAARFLPMEHWMEVKAAILALPRQTPRQTAHADRARWLFSLLYLGGLRASEVCSITMGSFFERQGADGKPRWWLEVTGKGSKTRLVPATDELVAELMRYREGRGLKALPPAGESLPAVLPLIGDEPSALSRSTVHAVVKEIVGLAADRVRQRGSEFEAAAAHLERASTHWLRHTAGSHMSDKIDLKAVRDHLGHENIATTSIYVHTEDDTRHDLTNAAHRAGW